MQNIGYYNGTFAPLTELMVPACDRGFFFGDGAYEAIRVEYGVPFALEEHLDRFEDSLRQLRIAMPMPREALTDVLMEAASRVDSEHQQLYFQVTRGTAIRVHAFPEGDVKPNLFVMTRHYPLAELSTPRKVITLPDLRWQHCNIKSLNLLPNIMAAQQAKDRGCAEAILHREGLVTECTASNLLMLKDGVLRTAPADCHIVPGVMRGHLLALARKNDIPVREEAFTLEEAMDADELLISSTSVNGAPIGEIDGKPVCGRDGQRLRFLQKAFRAYFSERIGHEIGI